MPEQVTLPYKFEPRWYQIPIFRDFDLGYKRFCLVWARRLGKDATCFNLLVKAMFERVGLYFYIFPNYTQGRKALWEAIGGNGIKMLDHIPRELVVKKNNQEMMIEVSNGSILRVIGADNPDTLVGTNAVGMVFSEYAIQDPRTWNYLRPILHENGGWAVFNSTPRSRNHLWDMMNFAKDHPDVWHFSMVTNHDTNIMTPELIEMERQSGMSEEMIQQEYYCSFEAATEGYYYQERIEDARQGGRIGSFPYDPNYPVFTSIDLGMTDSFAIWFGQKIGSTVRWINYYENSNKPLKFYVRHLMDLGYEYGDHCLPWDATHSNLQTGMTVNELFTELLENFQISGHVHVAPKARVQAGIEAVRSNFSHYYFDEEGCAEGLEKLGKYHAKYNEKKRTTNPTPEHDENSHCADGFRTYALLADDIVSSLSGGGYDHQIEMVPTSDHY